MAASSGHHTSSLSDIGEVELIQRFFESQPVSVTQQTMGIGDDCAVLNYTETQKLLITTDQLVERIHFLKEKSSGRDVGYKSVAVNFSDIAAMGGTPSSLFLSLALPAETSLSWLEEFREGFFELSKQYGVPLLGGDTTGSKQDIVINVTFLGKVNAGNIKLRSGAKDGDILCVTGPLGDSAAGLSLLSDAVGSGLNDEQRSFLIGRHHRPRPAVEEGCWLSEEAGVHAMIDLSDGLAADAGHIADKSKVGIDIELDRIPVSEPLKIFVNGREEAFIELTLYGGEDYHLLCSIAEGSYQDIASRFEQAMGSPLFQVGRVNSHHKEVKFFRSGKPVSFTTTGFDHFRAGHDL